MKKLFTLFCAACLMAGAAVAQDAKERAYLYPVLNAQKNDGRITPKPKVEGWASERIVDRLNRGVVALARPGGGVYVSWRLLDSDPQGVGFNVYRSTGGRFQKLNSRPITATTDFVDTRANAARENSYLVRPVTGGVEGPESEKAGIIPGGLNYTSIKFQGEYVTQKVALTDLNGDGVYDYVIKQPNQATDPGSWRRSTDTFKVEAYLSDGTFLWRKDLGWNIEQGVWYSPMIAYDFNGDGKAEIAVKTAPTDRDYRDREGRVIGNVPQYYPENPTDLVAAAVCPEFCSILDGMTGEVIDSVPWPEQSRRFGDYNRNNRNQMGMAYLDGKTPCLLLNRGTYRAMQVDAYQLKNGRLEKLWTWDGDEENPVIRSQGAHQILAADVDEDGRDEVIMGSVVIDDNGTALYSVGLGHPDKAYVAKVHPDYSGLQILYACEVWQDTAGVALTSAATGEYLWTIGHRTGHVGDGVAVDIDPGNPGYELFASEDSKGGVAGRYLFRADGSRIGSAAETPGMRNWIWWDADLIRETTASPPRDPAAGRGSRGSFNMMKYKGETPLTEGLQGSIMMIADLRGDWREEIITMLPGELRVYSTTIPATDRRVSLIQDPLYRSYIVHKSMGYEQPPTVSYYLGIDPVDAPKYTPLLRDMVD